MAEIKLSQLPQDAALDSTALIPLVQNGVTVNAPLSALDNRYLLPRSKSLVNNTPVDLFEFTHLPNTSFAGIFDFAIDGYDGANITIEAGSISFVTYNLAGVLSSIVTSQYFSSIQTTGGLLSDVWQLDVTPNNPVVVSFNPGNLGASFAAGYLTLHYTIKALTGQVLTFL